MSGAGIGDARNGKRTKTLITEVGPVRVDVPRDRDGTFTPQIVAKRQRRFGGVDNLVILLTAKGLTTGGVCAHLAEVYGTEVSKETISTITDRVLDSFGEWQSRPLDPVYPVVFIDCIHVKIRDGSSRHSTTCSARSPPALTRMSRELGSTTSPVGTRNLSAAAVTTCHPGTSSARRHSA